MSCFQKLAVGIHFVCFLLDKINHCSKVTMQENAQTFLTSICVKFPVDLLKKTVVLNWYLQKVLQTIALFIIKYIALNLLCLIMI
jgi:hypothetical protein